MPNLQPPIETHPTVHSQVNGVIHNRSTSSDRWLTWCRWSMGLAVLALMSTAIGATYQRYGQSSLVGLPLQTEAVKGHRWVAEKITFEQIDGHQFNVSFALNPAEMPTELRLQDIDLSLMIPVVPATTHGNNLNV